MTWWIRKHCFSYVSSSAHTEAHMPFKCRKGNCLLLLASPVRKVLWEGKEQEMEYRCHFIMLSSTWPWEEIQSMWHIALYNHCRVIKFRHFPLSSDNIPQAPCAPQQQLSLLGYVFSFFHRQHTEFGKTLCPFIHLESCPQSLLQGQVPGRLHLHSYCPWKYRS